MSLNDQITELRQEIDKQQEGIKTLQSLLDLVKTPAFQEHIIHGFCGDYLVTNLQLTLNNKVPEAVKQSAKDKAYAGAVLLNWLQEQEFLLTRLTSDMHENENTINELFEQKANGAEDEN